MAARLLALLRAGGRVRALDPIGAESDLRESMRECERFPMAIPFASETDPVQLFELPRRAPRPSPLFAQERRAR